MFANGVKIDGSWELRIFVTDLKVERKLRVMGDLHIGGVMLKLVDTLSKYINTNTGIILIDNEKVLFIRYQSRTSP